MGNLARVAILAIGAMAAKKYMNQQQRRQPYAAGTTDAALSPDLLDASGHPVHREAAGGSSLRSNPNLAWIADPELRSRNLERLRSLWSQRNQR